MAAMCAKIKAISGVLRESGGLDRHDGDALTFSPCAAVVDTSGRYSEVLKETGQVGRPPSCDCDSL